MILADHGRKPEKAANASNATTTQKTRMLCCHDQDCHPTPTRAILAASRVPYQTRVSERSKFSWGPKAFIVRIHDAPLQERLGYYEERVRS